MMFRSTWKVSHILCGKVRQWPPIGDWHTLVCPEHGLGQGRALCGTVTLSLLPTANATALPATSGARGTACYRRSVNTNGFLACTRPICLPCPREFSETALRHTLALINCQCYCLAGVPRGIKNVGPVADWSRSVGPVFLTAATAVGAVSFYHDFFTPFSQTLTAAPAAAPVAFPQDVF